MPQISRQVGTVSQKLNVFVQDATVTTGAGLANVHASTVLFGWCRDDQASVSTGTANTTSTLGIWSSAAWSQLSSTAMLGWYQFGAPDGVFVSGSQASVHFYGIPSGAVVPTLIELTKTNNQQYASSTNFSSAANVVAPVGVSSVPAVGVSSFAIPVGVSSFAIPVGVSSVANPVGVSTIPAVGVSSFAIAVGVSSFAIPVGVSSVVNPVGVSSIPAVGVSSFAIPVGVSSFAITVGVSSDPIAASVPASTLALLASSTFPFSLRASSAAGTLPQLMYEVLQNETNFTNAGTSRTLNDLSGAPTTVVYQYDSSTAPAAITRVA